jgi:transposase-like protein
MCSVLCPSCGHEGAVTGGRRVGHVRVRIRKCRDCGTSWKTSEGGEKLHEHLRRLEQENARYRAMFAKISVALEF